MNYIWLFIWMVLFVANGYSVWISKNSPLGWIGLTISALELLSLFTTGNILFV